jgi:hypothetical protein
MVREVRYLEESNNVIAFPVENRRLDLSNIGVDEENVYETILKMKKAYFSEVADSIAEDALRSIGCMDLEESKSETYDLILQDQVMIKEAVVSAMCRIVGIPHPFHDIAERYIDVPSGDEDDDSEYTGYFTYRLLDEPKPVTPAAEGSTSE